MQAALDFDEDRLARWQAFAGIRPPVWSANPCRYERQTIARLRDEPMIWSEFVRVTLRLIGAGRTHYSADAIMHVVRFERAVSSKDGEGYKINNNHVTHVARAFVRAYPEHGSFFTFREAA